MDKELVHLNLDDSRSNSHTTEDEEEENTVTDTKDASTCLDEEKTMETDQSTDAPDTHEMTDASDTHTDVPNTDQNTNAADTDQSTNAADTDQSTNTADTDQSTNTVDTEDTETRLSNRQLTYIERIDKQDETDKSTVTPTRSKKQPIPPEPFITLDQLDLSNIPQSWRDIVHVAPSRIPFGGNGLFAKRKLPYNTPIGFYFGVPMTEDEFDSLKDRVGRSSEYSIMYRRTVLDATDDEGQPITDEESPRFCPFHYMNETSSQKTASVAFVEGAIVNQIICWTKKDIEQGEELLVWYGKDVHRYWTEEEEEANRKKEHKESKLEKTRQVQERKMDRLLQRQERERVLQEKKKRKEMIKLDKLEQERIKKLKKLEKKTKKPPLVQEEMIVPEKGQLIIVDESGAFFTQDELDQQRHCTTQPMKDIILVNYSE